MMIAMCRGSRSGISSDCSSDSERCSSSDAVDFVMGGVYREALTLSNQPGPLHHASATLSSLRELCYKPSHRLVGTTCRCRSEEHTSELQSRSDLVCRLLLEKKKTNRRATLA